MPTFITVAAAAELAPGERMIVEIDETDIVIFNVDNRYYAVMDRCSHQDYPLSDGTTEGTTLECAAHGARFDLATGRALSMPAIAPVKRYETRVIDGELQVAV